MQCSKCGAAKMTERPEKPIGSIYLVRTFDCPRCNATTKEIRAVATCSPVLRLASNLVPTVPAIR